MRSTLGLWSLVSVVVLVVACAPQRRAGDDGDGTCDDCDAGQTTTTCDDGLSACGTECVDLTSDPTHCGTCSVACTQTEECTASACVALPTTCPPQGCPTGSYCNAANACVAGCQVDGSCAANQICVGNACVTGCRSDAACPASEACIQLQCKPTCSNDSQCALGQTCDSVSRQCVAGCTSDERCPAGQICNAGTCAAGCRGSAGSSCSVMSVTQAASSGSGVVQVPGAVVVAASVGTSSTGATTEMFYIEDTSGGPGVGVYRAGGDTTVPVVHVGDVVTVLGWLTHFDASQQLESSLAHSVSLSVTVTASGTGRAHAGAEAPAGSPTLVSPSAISGYDHTNASGHPEQVGTVLRFSGPLTVTDSRPDGFSTTNASGAPVPQGFQVTSGTTNIWVDDDFVYLNCLNGASPDLSNGIVGVWDRWQNGYVAGSPTYSVLVPMSCADLNP